MGYVKRGAGKVEKLMKSVAGWLRQGEDVILATIIADSGSAPRGAGARMAMTGGGSFTGTVGGGAVEYRVQQMALDALRSKKSRIKSFILSPNEKEDLGMVCGGNVTVHIQYISAADEGTRRLFAYGGELFSQNLDSWLITDITDETVWGMSIRVADPDAALPEGAPERALFAACGVQAEISGRRYYSEPLTRAGRVYIFGGGHIARELTPLLSHLGFRCFVFDSIAKFADRELFPTADGVVLGDFENISASVGITEKDYVVIMTRGHSSDFTVQAQALRLRPRYIGVIGSRAKIAAVSKKLRELGFSQEEIDSVHSPIGIPIKADTPAEIAVSIAAELIETRSRGIGG